MNQLEHYKALLLVIKNTDPKTRVAIVRSAPTGFIKALIEIVHNLLKGNIKIQPNLVRRLGSKKRQLRKFATYRTKRDFELARRQLLQQKGGFLPLLALALTPVIAPLIAKKVAQSATDSALDTVQNRVTGLIDKV